ncbi:glycosyltransferase, MGT family [Streptoalloteichus tenebrarius]|uniref:Glycosyltransferase, MGT family n=1 Tax=Streptoalloteichus tenebrarius (strain ATCC 17920 / DSM 40477 / JCM 4838 / CBS 697.72 / NBRC 16177 / NCIMB 11028 / NRRL B-12390 / A12253. 1 / ISP 5477) TaxID=1933 RepID=A0ABT1HLJ4_STRSD|nr:glycosyltransferase [Streptoalloteichus tenebrarius]MCP2256384.1 glycosyltransferase, MGT family [Streptoalloteichus tenebrarius]BFF04729.1 glycosyltransferase [Streptoalloteichus tenebrarius]
MRVLFSSISTYGHFFPLLPLAVATARAGHHVGFAVNESLHPYLSGLGVEPIPAGPPISEAFAEAGRQLFGERANHDELTPAQWETFVAATFGSVLPSRYAEDVGRVVARFHPDLVVYDSVCVGAGMAAARAGTPAVAHGLSHHSLNVLTPEYVRRVDAVAEELGLAMSLREPNPLGHPYLDIYPASMQDPDFVARATRFALRPVPFSRPAPLPEWVRSRDRGRPLVYVTLGTEAGAEGADDLLREIVHGVAALDADVLVATGPKLTTALLADAPDNVVVESWVPQAELLPHLDLIVHHAGSGTMLGALGQAVPQLVLPRGADQFVNAEAVVAAGVGVRLLPDEVTASSVSGSARRLLDDGEFRVAARRAAEEIAAMPSPEEVAGILPRLAGR